MVISVEDNYNYYVGYRNRCSNGGISYCWDTANKIIEPRRNKIPIKTNALAHPDIGLVVQYNQRPAAKIAAPDSRSIILKILRKCIDIFYKGQFMSITIHTQSILIE